MPCQLPDNEELVEFIKSFNAEVKPKILELFEKYNSNVITFHSHKEADDYIENLNRIDLTLKTEKGLFNHRVAAVIIHDNKILAQMNEDNHEYYLVGGRVQFGESTEEALIREVKEELNISVTEYRPIWINEGFFICNDSQFHEIGMYYLVNIDNAGFNHFEMKFTTTEKEKTNHYEWLEINKLDNYILYPLFIKDEIKSINNSIKLIITKEV